MDEFLRILARSLLDGVDATVFSDSALQAGPELARSIWETWTARGDAETLRQALVGMAAATRPKVEETLNRTVAGLGVSPEGEMGKSVRAYLRVVPCYVRRESRGRAAGPALETAADLLRLLP